MNLDVLDGTWAWVWKETPEPVRFCRGLIVRAANGNATTAPDGFDFGANYDRWRASFAGPMVAWTYLYQSSDPLAAAAALTRRDAVAYLIDWEDAAGTPPDGERFRRTVGHARQFRPGRPIGFSSYPTRAQAVAHGVDWDAGIQVCDFVAPQMYYGYQVARYTDILRDAGPRYTHLDLEPSVNLDWARSAAFHLDSGRGVSFWRLGILSPTVRAQIQALEEAHDVSIADVTAALNTWGKSDGFKAAVRAALGLQAGEQVASNTDIVTILRGDPTHLDNLHSIQLNTQNIIDAIATPPTPGPGPAPVQVSGTWTGTITAGGVQ